MDAKTLALYFGCEFEFQERDDLKVVKTLECIDSLTVKMAERGWLKPILRPLSSMTAEEATEYLKLKYNAIENFNFVEKDLRGYGGFWFHVGQSTAKPTFIMFTQILEESRADQFIYLLSKGFDLFGLHEKGEAISKP